MQLVQHYHAAAEISDSGWKLSIIAAESLQKLVMRPWTGNVRELENCLTRAVILATGGVIRPEHLAAPTPAVQPAARLGSLAEIERQHIVQVLAATGGQKVKAARILGVSRPRLDRLLWKHGIQRT